MSVGNYLTKIVQMQDAGALPRVGVAQLAVFHDDWCALLATTGACDCDPEVRLNMSYPILQALRSFLDDDTA